jgi:cytochrome c556
MPVRSLLFAGSCLLLVATVLFASPPSSSQPTASVPADTTKPLKPLMVGLAQDMDRIATGLWHEDYDLIRQGARGIAQHPKIPPSQIAAIKDTLGNQFPTFVQYDKSVHRAASQLVTATEAKDWSSVLETHERLQEGCLSCHTAFRSRVRPVLNR